MSGALQIPDDDDVAERLALEAAIAESDADPRVIPHERVREWLLKLAGGEFGADMPATD